MARSRRQIKKLLQKSQVCDHDLYGHAWRGKFKNGRTFYVTDFEVAEAGLNPIAIFMKQGLYP